MEQAQELHLKIRGMHCAGCAIGIEKGLAKLDGIKRVQVNFATETARIDFEPDRLDSRRIVDTIAEIGYQAESSDRPSRDEPDEQEWAQKRLAKALAFTVPIIILSMINMAAGRVVIPLWLQGMILLVLTAPVLFGCGREILVDAWRGARQVRANMNTLIAIGSLTAFLYSVYVLSYVLFMKHLDEPHFYFETTAMIITLILLGRYLENRAKTRARDSIGALLRLRPEYATVMVDGIEQKVATSELTPGMVVAVKPGERIAADGIITVGTPSIDESMLTGESVPVDHTVGERVIGGSINGNTAFRFEVTGSGADTFLSGIIKMVSEAQDRKAPVQRLADTVAGVFVPIVLILAVVTFAVWFLVDRSSPLLLTAPVAVLIVACPCALGLATPTAVLAGTGRAARRGIYIRGGDILERMVHANHVVFDKTGTLTRGSFEVVAVMTSDADRIDDDKLLQLAGSIERGSQHPLADAIVRKAERKGLELLPVKDLTEFPGFGLRGEVQDRVVLVGNIETMEKEHIEIAGLRVAAEEEMNKGRTVVFVAAEGRGYGFLGLSDQIKEEAPGVIKRLQAQHREVVVLTGDNYRTAAGVAAQLGVGRFEAGVKPDQKAIMVEAFRRAGNTVMMVGDGINDAPALAAADIGVALGNGTDVAIESADVILVRDDLESLLEAFAVAKLTYGTIKQNLFWAFFYNILAIPLAAGVFYPVLGWSLSPVVAAGAMAFSSVLVVSNSIRLLKAKALQSA
ncbi:MAG: cadmium-translocating P-type ATPase [candidate division Zixibacteria bacterium]|nr:cadmium-translocating P-type ATPase [candidate division Zixibacteria bacterium]